MGDKIKRICKVCGKEFFVIPAKAKTEGLGKYCSNECRHIGHNTKVKRKCPICGEYFFVHPSGIKRGQGKYCSRVCMGKATTGKNNPSWNGGKIKRICKTCGKEFYINKYKLKTGEGVYCSIECMADGYKGEKSPVWKGGLSKRICQICGKEFLIITAKIKNGFGKYCSTECAGEAHSIYYSGENSPMWKGGISFAPYCPKFNERRKKAVRDFFNNTCLACGKLSSENVVGKKGVINLPVHHADHDKDQGCDGKPFNLVPLCNECHGKELWNEEEYCQYINKTLREGFKWGIWNEEEYIRKVMYPED